MREKGKVILLGKEGVGHGDETMGFEMLMTLLDSLAKREDKPYAIVFWNTAVQLLVTGSPAIGRLKTLEEKGVKIVAGRFCLTDLCIADTVAVGKAAGMEEILDLLFNHEVISF
jgi:intracellular sulfur oxidation DsrE/DsrF family protein